MDVYFIVFLSTLVATINIEVALSAPATANNGVNLPVRGVFYAFDANGIAILDPASKKITKKIDASTKLPGTTATICTPSMRSRTNCSWAGAVFAPNKYIFAADSNGNRLIVIDVEKQMVVKAIQTDPFPYQVEYIAAMDEVWVLCWGNSTLNVIGVRNVTMEIAKIKDAKLLLVKHSIKAQGMKSHKGVVHGFFRAENCQSPDKQHKYGIVSHYREPGIHKINLSGKTREKFINTSAHGCKKTFHINYSSVKKYALVQCLGDMKDTMIVVDVAKDKVVHSNDAMTNDARGYPYMSPDGKYALVLQSDKIIPYYFESAAKDMVRLKDIIIAGGFWPSTVAFVKRKDGYTAYVTAKNDSRILLINLEKGAAKFGGFIAGVGFAADLSNAALRKNDKFYKPSFMRIIKAQGRNYSEAEFHDYVFRLYMEHTTRMVRAGCGAADYYVASPSYFTHKVALMDARSNRLLGLVEGLKSPAEMIWVGGDSSMKIKSNGMCHGPVSVLAFLVMFIALVI